MNYIHPGYKKPYPIDTVLRDLASQEGCDGEPYDVMIAAAGEIARLTAELTALRAGQDALVAAAYEAAGQEADEWKSWLDDLPLHEDFSTGIDRLQYFITRIVAALDLTPAPEVEPVVMTAQDAARVPEIKALIEAANGLGLRALVAGWNGEGLDRPYTPHKNHLSATIKTTCGTVYAIDAALRAIAGSDA